MLRLTLVLALASVACAVTPDCSATFQFTNDPTIQPRGGGVNGNGIYALGQAAPAAINNNLGASSCQGWTFLYSFAGLLNSSIQINEASTANGPFAIWPGTINYGSNPYQQNTGTQQNNGGYTNLLGTYNYIQVTAPYWSGTGTILVQAFGWINPLNVGSLINYPNGASGVTPVLVYAAPDATRTATGTLTLLTSKVGSYRVTAYTANLGTVCSNTITLGFTDQHGAETPTIVASTTTGSGGDYPVNIKSGNLTLTSTIGGTCTGSGFDTSIFVESLGTTSP